MTFFRVAADEYTFEDLKALNPVGESWRRFSRGLSNVIEELKKNPMSKAYFLIGKYGMGKTLFIRKKLTELVRLEPNVALIYAPLRRLSDIFLKIRERDRGVEGFLKLLGKWFHDEGYSVIEERNVWRLGKSLLNGSEVDRLRVIYSAFSAGKDLSEALRSVNEHGLIPLLVFDELEALVVRGTRWNLSRRIGEPSAHSVIRELFNNIYIIASGVATWRGLVVFASVFDYEEWIRYPLREVALSPEYSDDPVVEFLTAMGVSTRAIERIRSIDDIDGRLKAIDEEVKRVRQSNPLLQQATQERLRAYTLKIKYQAEEYEKLAEMFNIKLAIEGLLNLFERIELKPRTLVYIVMKLRELGVNELTYETLSKIIKSSIKFDDFRIAVERVRKRVPVHAKWPQRLLGLIEEGLILFDYDIVLFDPAQRDELLGRISRALGIEVRRPLNAQGLEKIRNILDGLRLNYEIVKLDYLRDGKGLHRKVYYIDEDVVRWILGDIYDKYGEEIDIERRLEEMLEFRSRRYRGSRREAAGK